MKKLMVAILLLGSWLYGSKHKLEIIKPEYDVAKYILQHPTEYNIRYLKTIIKYGRKYNMVYTLMSIAIHESRLGKYLVNNHGDYCFMHINARWYLYNHGITPTYYKKLKLGSDLLRDDNMCVMAAIENLLQWKEIYNNNWRKIWGSYNGGNTPNYHYSNYIYSIQTAIGWFEWQYHCKFKDYSCLKVMKTFLK